MLLVLIIGDADYVRQLSEIASPLSVTLPASISENGATHDMLPYADPKFTPQTLTTPAGPPHHGQRPNSRSHSESFLSAFR